MNEKTHRFEFVKDTITNLYGYINHKGEFVIPPRFMGAGDFSEGLATVATCCISEHNDPRVWGYIDKTGEYKIMPRFVSYTSDFENGFAYGVSLFLGDSIMYEENGEITAFSNKSTEIGFFNTKGQFISEQSVEINSKSVEYIEYPYIIRDRHRKYKYGLLDKNKTMIVKPKYERINPFSEGWAVVEIREKKVNFINLKGEFLSKVSFQRADDFHEGVASIEIKDKYGFINTMGKIVIPPIFEQVRQFSEGLCAVKYKGKWGFIRKP